MNILVEMIIKLLILSLLANNIYAIGVTDFVPGFITSVPTESADPNLPIKPLVNTNRKTNASNAWYCNRSQNEGNGGNSVFCKNNVSDTVARGMTYDGNDNSDKSQVVDITTQAAQTTANQNSLLDQSTKKELDKSRNTFTLPIQPSKNVNMYVGQSQVDFNIKY